MIIRPVPKFQENYFWHLSFKIFGFLQSGLIPDSLSCLHLLKYYNISNNNNNNNEMMIVSVTKNYKSQQTESRSKNAFIYKT